jgi:NADPH2:quinone reductase
MKAAFIDRHGPAENIRYGDLPLPQLDERGVLVRVSAVTVNHVDTFIRSGAFPSITAFPFVIGRDMTGVVETVGDDVRSFRAGERVWSNCLGIDRLQGTFADYLSVPEDRLYRLPDGVDPLEVVAVLHSALTAAIGLFDKAGLAEGETLFINGGSGSVGTAVSQIAKSCGARVAVTAGSEEKQAWCRQAGADRAIRYHGEDVDRALRDFAPEGVDVYWDATSTFDMEQALRRLARRGRIVVMAGLDHSCRLPLGPFYTRNASLFGFTVTGTTTEEYAGYARQINDWLANKTLRARIQAVLPLSEAARAHGLQEDGKLFGKVVLVPEGSKRGP